MRASELPCRPPGRLSRSAFAPSRSAAGAAAAACSGCCEELRVLAAHGAARLRPARPLSPAGRARAAGGRTARRGLRPLCRRHRPRPSQRAARGGGRLQASLVADPDQRGARPGTRPASPPQPRARRGGGVLTRASRQPGASAPGLRLAGRGLTAAHEPAGGHQGLSRGDPARPAVHPRLPRARADSSASRPDQRRARRCWTAARPPRRHPRASGGPRRLPHCRQPSTSAAGRVRQPPRPGPAGAGHPPASDRARRSSSGWPKATRCWVRSSAPRPSTRSCCAIIRPTTLLARLALREELFRLYVREGDTPGPAGTSKASCAEQPTNPQVHLLLARLCVEEKKLRRSRTPSRKGHPARPPPRAGLLRPRRASASPCAGPIWPGRRSRPPAPVSGSASSLELYSGLVLAAQEKYVAALNHLRRGRTARAGQRPGAPE